MEIILLVPLATQTRAHEKGERVTWPDRADALRLVKAGFAKPAPEDTTASASAQAQAARK